MKKVFLVISVAALALTACTSESVEYVGSGPEAKEIAFSPLSRPSTRAAGAAEYNAVEGTGYPQNYDMKVVAYTVPKTSADGVAGNYFGETSGQEFTFQPRTSNGYWAGTTVQYWPLAQASLNFLAVSYEGSPTANPVTPTFAANWASGVSVALADNRPASANSGATLGQHDLMYAYGRATVTKSGNALTIPEKVDMTFNHALAWVYFRVKGDANAASNIVIESITLKNAYYAGTFTAAVTNYDSYDAALSWTAANTKWTAAPTPVSDIVSPNQTKNADGDGNSTNESQTLTTSFAPVGDGILIVPTYDLSKVSFDSFVIKYWMNGRTYSYEYTPADADKTLRMGKKYIYDITMKLSEIFVDASVADWEDGGTTFVDIPQYTAGAARTFDVRAEAATYTFVVSGFAANEAVTITETDANNLISTLTPTGSTTADSNGDLKITFVTNASDADKTATIEIDSSTDSHDTTITVSYDAP